ncbi:MAG: hypothetical protein HY717_10130 [Planctomycetes bacterium]|nr:hypothetical protein [Planctomycetota bacterium]
MGLFAKLFGFKVPCPWCGAPGARETFIGVYCVNPRCSCFDEDYARRSAGEMPFSRESRARPGGVLFPAAPEPSAPPASPIEIQYVNFRGEHKTFVGDKSSARKKGAHLSIEVAPKYKRIALKLEKIANRDQVLRQIGSGR